MENNLALAHHYHEGKSCIATDKALFHLKNADIFLISQQKHMLWVLIRSATVRRF